MEKLKTNFDEFNVRLSRTLNGKYAALITFITIILFLIAMGVALNFALKNVESMEKIDKLETVNIGLMNKMEMADFEYSAALSTADIEIDSLERQLDSIKTKTKVVYINTLKRDGVLITDGDRVILNFNALLPYAKKQGWYAGVNNIVYSRITIRYYQNDVIGTY